MDIKVYDEKVRDLQGHLTFLGNLIKNLEAKPNVVDHLKKIKKLYELVESTKTRRHPIDMLIKVEKAINVVKARSETKSNDPSHHNVSVKKEGKYSEVSDTPDSPTPSPTRHYGRTTPIEIPTERSDDRDQKFHKEKDSRYDDNRRHRSDHHRSDRSDKYNFSRYSGSDRNRSRFDQHERSKSRDRDRDRDRYRNDRRERSDSSERGRYVRSDKSRYHRVDHDNRDSRDNRDNSWKKYDERNDRVGSVKAERSDVFSQSGTRDYGKSVKNLDNDLQISSFHRVGGAQRPTATVAKPLDREGFTQDEINDLNTKNRKLYGCDSDDESDNNVKSLLEVRSKLANQIKLAEIRKNREQKPSNSDLPDISKVVLNAPNVKPLSSRECTPPKEDTNKYNFIHKLNASNDRSAEVTSMSKDAIKIDDDIIKKIAAQPMATAERISPDLNIIKQALETAKSQERLALKYLPKPKVRSDVNISEPTMPPQTHLTEPNNLQLVSYNDPRLPPRARDPRVQAQQDSLRIRPFSPPSTPPCMPNYPPMIQSSTGYKQNTYPNLYATPNGPQNPYPSNISPQNHPHQNLVSIPTHGPIYNNHRAPHHQSPVSSSDMIPQQRYQYPPPTYPEHRQPSGIHNKFRPSLNDSVERQKYEQSRSRRSSTYHERESTPKTYGEYKRSLQAAVSSTSEKVNNKPTTQIGNISTSYHDKAYRSGNYSTPIQSMTAQPNQSKFKIPKKTVTEPAQTDPKDSEDEQVNIRTDDSESEISVSEKITASNESDAIDNRDPRVRVQALKKAAQSSETKTKDSAEKQNNVVTSSTSIVTETTPPAENAEFLKLINPTSLLAIINMLGPIPGDSTIEKVKTVLEKAFTDITNTSNDVSTVSNDVATGTNDVSTGSNDVATGSNDAANTPSCSTNEEVLSSSAEQKKVDMPKTPRKRGRNELDKLNEDIRTMFISDGVLNATGRRVCALYNKNTAEKKEATAAKIVKSKKSKDDATEKKNPPVENRITRRRNTIVCHNELSAKSVRTETTKEQSPAPQEPPKATSTPATAKKTQEEIFASISAIAKTNISKDESDDASTIKRVTRAQLKECNIVLEKLSTDASVESVTKAENLKKRAKLKRSQNDSATKKVATKKTKKSSFKNINAEYHCLNKVVDCQQCDKAAKLSLVSHYVNVHPTAEILTSRLTPDAADALRERKKVVEAKRVVNAGKKCHEFINLCYFCNEIKCYPKSTWMTHIATHTGYYQYKCNDCSRKFSQRTKTHMCKGSNNIVMIPQPQFEEKALTAFLCNLCNFIRFHRNEIEKHLRCEHETPEVDKFKEVALLVIPRIARKKSEKAKEAKEDEEETLHSDDNEETKPIVKRRRKVRRNVDKIDESECSPEKVSRPLPVVHTEAFISEPKLDDGLFDQDTMKLMKDMSFSASKDVESAAPSKRVKSIAEKLNERFKSAQEDSVCESSEKPETKPEPLDPMTCDEGIPIIRVKPMEDCPPEETNTESERVLITIEKVSPSVAPRREDMCTPTEEFNDESDDNWESYSSNDSDEETEAVDESKNVVNADQLNRKNVGIIDTIARLQQSISSQTTSSVEGVEKLPETTFTDDNTVKDEELADHVPNKPEDQVEADEEKKNESVQSDNVENAVEEEKECSSNIVDEPMELDDGATDAKSCVNNGRLPNTNRPFNFKGNGQSSQFPSRQLGGFSSNADSLNNDVDMLDVETPSKILTRIDNIGYTRSTESAEGSVKFCCLIDDCGFESPDLSDLLCHIEDHQVEWTGFCYSCNAQIKNDRVQLVMEFMHMTQKHYNRNIVNETVEKANAANKPALIKCKLLPGDKLSKLKEDEIAAKAGNLSLNPKPSTSKFIRIDSSFLKIANVTTLKVTEKKADDPPMLITKVESLGSAGKEYTDSDLVSLKSWQRNPTNKLQKNCKKMLRDICLYALFKCMDINCAFTTDNADNMLIHLRNHENVSSEPSWLECAYCDIVADSCSLLVKHVQDEHQSSIFQCPYCFYRSCAAYNVIVHLKQFHASDKMSVLVCNGKPRLYTNEKALIEKSRGENIRPLRCTEGCNKITYVMDNFVKHMLSSPAHGDKFKCQFCGFHTLISETSKHLLVHSVGVYECVYCHYGINDVESIQNHMCNTHPSKLLYICVRLTPKDRSLTDEQLSSVESTMLFHLGLTVDNKLFQRCPFTDEQLSYMNPSIMSNVTETALVASQSIPSTSSSIPSVSSAQPSIGINIASVASISSDLFSNVTEPIAATNTGLMLNDVLSYKDLEKYFMADDWDKYFASLPESNAPPLITKRRTTAAQPKAQLPENKSKASTSAVLRTDLLQEEIDNAAYNLVKGTGLEGSDLYRCSFTDCGEKSNDIFFFNMHLVKHNSSVGGFKCYHCSVVSKNIVGLKYHIKVHGIHRYFCYYCNYTSSIVNDIQKHMQDTHSRTHVTTIPLNPKKPDQNKDMFVMCPGGLRQEELNRFGIALIDRNKRQLTSTKKFYSPDDIDSLPRQAIFNISISCEVCDYSTKVRTNMYRHLVAHKDEKSVPKVDPVNPVPCLDTGEKHFDKMINLACSSNDNKATSTPYDTTAFVPETRRFVCNARNCQYQNISEGMLKRHLTTLHPNEEHYKCPHCNSAICQKMDADKVIFHLRMHDSKIYKCPKCLFAHHAKSIVEKHKEETHLGVAEPAMLITRDETTSSAPDGQPKVSKWQCSLCNELFATQKLVQAHIQTSHSIKFQYQCDICSEVQSNNKSSIQEHINLKHPNMGNRIKVYYTKVECTENDNTPIWRRDDPNKIKHIRGILFEEENVRKTSTTSKKDQTEVKKKTSQKKRSDKPVVEQNTDNGHVPVTHQSEIKGTEDSESNAVVIISDDDTSGDVEKVNNGQQVVSTTCSNPIPSSSKNLLESGKSYMGNSVAMIKPSSAVVRAEATSSGIKTKKDVSVSLDKTYLCGRCCEFSGNTIQIVRAHQATAHPNVVCEVFMRNTNTNKAQPNQSTPKPLPDATANDSNYTFCESINYVCYHCIYKSQSPTIIYKHWKENHKFPKITTRNIEFPSRPFMFRTIKIFQCCYCRRCSHYRDLKVHCQRTHPKQTFAMIDKLNPDKCAFCLHEFSSSNTNAIEHFNEFHKNLATDNLTEPNNYFNNELIEQITAVLPRDQVKCTHTNCNIIFFSKAELLAHTTEKHPGSDMQFVSIPNDPIMYGCINCAETSASETEMVTHIRKHLLQYQCKFCEKRFSHLEMIKVHHEIMHASKDVTYRNIDINENLDKYLAMKIIFPNGLVFTKGSAKYTKYGQMDGNIKLIAELDAKELEAAKKRQAEIETEPLLMPLKISKKSLKRGRISDSSDSDGSPHKAKRVTTHKKRAKSFRAKSPKPAVESSSSNSDDNLPLKSLIPFSYYGRNKEQVDLSKIFIEMPFGSSTVRVSCERFSLLFNINPKLCIKRCTD